MYGGENEMAAHEQKYCRSQITQLETVIDDLVGLLDEVCEWYETHSCVESKYENSDWPNAVHEWWVDRQRKKEAEQQALQQRALSKLTPEERKALGY